MARSSCPNLGYPTLAEAIETLTRACDGQSRRASFRGASVADIARVLLELGHVPSLAPDPPGWEPEP